MSPFGGRIFCSFPLPHFGLVLWNEGILQHACAQFCATKLREAIEVRIEEALPALHEYLVVLEVSKLCVCIMSLTIVFFSSYWILLDSCVLNVFGPRERGQYLQ